MQQLKVLYHPMYEEDYPTVSVEAPERERVIREELKGDFKFVTPSAATEEDILLVHTHPLLHEVKRDPLLFQVASLAVGGAIQAAHIAYEGLPFLGGQRLTLHSEALASLKGLEVLKKIGISDEGLTSARAMMAQLLESYCNKCARDVVDEVLQHPRVRELTG